MTADEAEALFLAGVPGPAAELGLGTVVAAARLKVLAALPPELRTRASRLVERFHLDAVGWYQGSEPVPQLAAISEAVWESQRISVDYRRDRIVTRLLDPLGLVLKAGVWYVVALAQGQIRTYRVSRISRSEPTGERFERPRDFDLAGYWTESTAAYERETPRTTVTVRVRRERMGRLRDVVSQRVMEDAEHLSEDDPAGWSTLRLALDWPDEIAGRLLALGPDLEIVEPASLRAEIVALAGGVTERYATG
jgi:predicted DNA-binding transcriptional regulator YafY